MSTESPSKRPGKPGGRRDANRRRRLQSLSQSALDLFLQHGIEKVRIDEIAAAAGTAKGNFYRYFEDKSALVRSLIDPVSTAILASMDRCAAALDHARDGQALTAAYQQMAAEVAAIVLGNEKVFLMYLQEHRSPARSSTAPLQRVAKSITERSIVLTQHACEHGLLRVSDPRVSTLAVLGAVERLVLAVLTGEFELDPANIATTLIDLTLDGLRPQSAAARM